MSRVEVKYDIYRGLYHLNAMYSIYVFDHLSDDSMNFSNYTWRSSGRMLVPAHWKALDSLDEKR